MRSLLSPSNEGQPPPSSQSFRLDSRGGDGRVLSALRVNMMRVQDMADLKKELEAYDGGRREPLESLFGGTAAEVLAAASLDFTVITAEVLDVGR